VNIWIYTQSPSRRLNRPSIDKNTANSIRLPYVVIGWVAREALELKGFIER
jgi:hypothetical protein